MTDRKPDFWVVRSEQMDGANRVTRWLDPTSQWYGLTARYRYLSLSSAASDALHYGGTVHPVFCTSKRAEPKMRERSSAWVLKRLAEGKVLYRPRHAAGSIMFSETLIRWERVDGIIEFCVPGEMVWSSKRGQLCFDGKMLCRIARPSEVPQ